MWQKQALLIFALVATSLMMTACSNTTEKTAETSPSLLVNSDKIKQQHHKPNEKTYPETNNFKPVSSINSSDSKSSNPTELFNSIWERIRAGFQISDYHILQPKTQYHLRWFIDHPQHIERVVERARPYLYYIVEEVKKRNMPMEVALLPVVESGFEPHAHSPSHAAGLWQFIPSTGKFYGLTQNWWYDGRRDIIRSTQAALDYLEKLYSDFGDWQLAIAAYNCGEGTVNRAIKRNQKRGKATDFWSLDLPKETSAYVPKLMAVSHLVKFPARYNISLSPIDNNPYIGTVDVGSQIDLAVAAEMAGISKDELDQLNPAFNRWATAPEGPHQLVLPLKTINQFKQALAKLPAHKRVKWVRHQIQRGESLSVIADRFNTTVTAIKKGNQLSGDQIRTGHYLLIPLTPNQLSRSELTKSESLKQQKQVYIVKNGDTWKHIAFKYQIDVTNLTDWNKKSAHDPLRPGQKLVIWSQADKGKSINYRIKFGDSLWTISRRFNVSVADLREWNELNKNSILQPGQNLKLYLNES